MKIIVWFRQDLRLKDNPALHQAAQDGLVIPLYILDDITPGDWKIGGASRWWLHNSLDSLENDLKKSGTKLILRHGRADEILPKIIKETGADAVYWNRCYEPFNIARDKKLKETLSAKCKSFNGSLLHEPWEIKNKQGGFFKVYTPFWKHCLSLSAPRSPLPLPKTLKNELNIKSDRLADWKLLPTKPNWAKGFTDHWHPGENGAAKQLTIFLDGAIENYSNGRDMPGISGTSKISPHLHFGEISPNQVWHAANFTKNARAGDNGSKNLDKFLAEIGWREFAHHLLYHFPEFPEKPFNNKFNKFPWEHDEKLFDAWKAGKTGYPIVDAGMRQLWQTGWMHNRVRMIVASFLTKHLLISWQDGAKWFWDTLVDADLANNSAGWQWVAGCGADAAPYFRVFNPILQGEKFDPNGEYVRKYIPELSFVPNSHIHKPWEWPEFNPVRLQYPLPVIDHQKGRQGALNAYRNIK